MAQDRKYVGSAELYQKIKDRPDWRVVEGIPGNSNACVPLQFVFDSDGLRFHHDMTATQMHKHAMCEDILDAIYGMDYQDADADVLIAEHDGDFNYAHHCSKISFDESVKWIKLMPAD